MKNIEQHINKKICVLKDEGLELFMRWLFGLNKNGLVQKPSHYKYV
ncbi:hypothetical protein [Pedobacter sp. Leaf170]|nr:hypothetical protein [Pedobacter sp. Leaf170]